MKKTIVISCKYHRELRDLLSYMDSINFNDNKLLKIKTTKYGILKFTVKGKKENIVELKKLLLMQDVYFQMN